MKCPFFIFLLLITINNQLICQNDTINLRDNNGLPHGYWEKYKDDRLFIKGILITESQSASLHIIIQKKY